MNVIRMKILTVSFFLLLCCSETDGSYRGSHLNTGPQHTALSTPSTKPGVSVSCFIATHFLLTPTHSHNTNTFPQHQHTHTHSYINLTHNLSQPFHKLHTNLNTFYLYITRSLILYIPLQHYHSTITTLSQLPYPLITLYTFFQSPFTFATSHNCHIIFTIIHNSFQDLITLFHIFLQPPQHLFIHLTVTHNISHPPHTHYLYCLLTVLFFLSPAVFFIYLFFISLSLSSTIVYMKVMHLTHIS